MKIKHSDGSDILYLAAEQRQVEIIDFLLENTDIDPYGKNILSKCSVDMYPNIRRKMIKRKNSS